MFKKIALIFSLISLVSLTGCFGGSDETEETDLENYKTYNAPSFSVSLPQNWEIIEPNEFSDEIPPETQVVLRDNIISEVFTTNANITKELLAAPTTSYDYAKASINENKATLLNYKEISRDDEFNVLVNGEMERTALIMFEGKPLETDPTLRLIQTYAVNGTDAYTITAAYLKTADEFTVETAKNIVKSFKVK